MRDSTTLRTALFKQIEGLQDGSVKPDTAKATAQCAMAICKTVELDLKATDTFKGGGAMKAIPLTDGGEPEKQVLENDEEIITEDQIESILKGHKNGLPAVTIASRLGLELTDVKLVIETRSLPTPALVAS